MKKFTRKQLVFITQNMIDSAISIISTSIPGRWIDKESKTCWIKTNDLPKIEQRENICNQAIIHLGWNLSILFAQLYNDGISEMEVLQVAGLLDPLEEWAEKWAKGEIGIISTAEDQGQASQPDINVKSAVDKLFGDYIRNEIPG